jgi:hypothetical protein
LKPSLVFTLTNDRIMGSFAGLIPLPVYRGTREFMFPGVTGHMSFRLMVARIERELTE